ncbi:aldolase/citrate lyase family protein [Actinotalea sp. K2]|uniref:HpcH/HpaI aldolase family protein n=1 Tax=Actinotalea sp. K2 TaxID=2939438 RepID=UPI002017187B|nr:aldolase/citrate lyase family protein [Actinotalea sp. K2]MCL3859754.1 aldolase/citrate lyase family protein [Actinotalea sp. K2]
MSPTEGVTAASAAHLRDLWARDLPAFGLWSVLADPAVAEVLAASPFDYVCLDLQHGVATFSELPDLLRSMRGAGLAPVVRVPWNEPAGVMRALDTGAAAVLVPMVNSADDARRAAAACRFPPVGERSWGPMWGDSRPDGALPPAQQDAAVLCLVMVETQAGVDALEEIVRVPGVDGVYIGPNDLALGCGHGRATYRDSAEVDALIEHVVTTCRAAGVVAGLHCSDPEMALHWAGRGVRLLTAAQDTTLLRVAAADAWASVARGSGRGT